MYSLLTKSTTFRCFNVIYTTYFQQAVRLHLVGGCPGGLAILLLCAGLTLLLGFADVSFGCQRANTSTGPKLGVYIYPRCAVYCVPPGASRPSTLLGCLRWLGCYTTCCGNLYAWPWVLRFSQGLFCVKQLRCCMIFVLAAAFCHTCTAAGRDGCRRCMPLCMTYPGVLDGRWLLAAVHVR